MHVLITGGTGFIGRSLIPVLLSNGHCVTCLSRSLQKVADCFGEAVEALDDLPQANTIYFDVIINLAGEAIADRRWSAARKRVLRDSRLHITRKLVDWIAASEKKPTVFISGSAIGFYGSQMGDQALTEEAAAQSGFTHTLCQDWEAQALQAQDVRVCLLRTGIVLGLGGGALAKMLLPFKCCLGGPIASGKQWMSWVHIEDVVAIIMLLIERDTLCGPFNVTAPGAVDNATFSRTLGQVLGRPACLRMPKVVVTCLLGEGAQLLVQGQRVYPEKLQQAGYLFKYPKLSVALASLLS